MTKKIILLTLSALLLSACSLIPTPPSSNTTPSNSQISQTTVEIKGFAFSPNNIKVKPGTAVTFTNRDVASHTVTSDDGKSFNTPLIGKDQSQTITVPTTPGTYTFHCTPHPNMKGTIVVE